MANPFGTNQFQQEPQYGDVSKLQQLSREAPISGAPLPGSSTTNAPISPGAKPPMLPGPQALPFVNPPGGVDYYQRLARTWRALARLPGASDAVKEHAANAQGYAKKYTQGQV
jgi:hypothetical protein